MKKLFTLLALLFSFQAFAVDFYVSTTGSDDNEGSSAKPWQTIQHAMEEAIPGSTVFIEEGSYNAPLYLEVSGTENNIITFKARDGKEVIVSAEEFSSSAILEIYEKNYVSIEGITFQNMQKNDAIGIYIEGGCTGISIINCVIRNINFSSNPDAAVNENTNSQPLIVYGSDADRPVDKLTIKGNLIYNCITGYSEALAINGNVDGFLVEDNIVHSISNIGIDIIGHEGTCSDPLLDQARNGIIRGNKTYNCKSPYATSAGIYVDGGKDLVIEQNEVYNNQWGIEIGCENIGKTTDGIVVRNNIVYSNQTAGLHVGGYDYPNGSGKVVDVQVVNNTFFGNDIENDGTGEIYLSYNENLQVYNNIFTANNGDGAILSTEDLSVESKDVNFGNNNWYSYADQSSGYYYYNGKDYDELSDIEAGESGFTDNITGDPILDDNNKYHLSSSSPLINSGLVSSELKYGDLDFDNDPRVMGDKIDIGADEFSEGTSSIVSESTDSEVSIFPNPTCDFIYIKNAKNSVTHIEIFNVVGQRKFSTKKTDSPIDLRSLKSGIYLLHLYEDGRIAKILKIQKVKK